MKKMLLASMALIIASACFAQSEKFTKAMTTNISLLDSAKTPDDMLALSATFERIADAEKTQWLPYYYAAFTEVLYGYMKNDAPNNDTYADKAAQLLDKAEALEKNNSEIAVIKSMIASLHMMVNPAQRYQQYGSIANAELTKAKQEDANNPRPYYIQGQGLFHTPEQYGGGCKTAKPVLEQAAQKFETFKPASALHPNWGKAINSQLLEGCK